LFFNLCCLYISFTHLPVHSSFHFSSFPFVKEIKTSKMERLPDDTLLIILKKVASSSAKNFFRLRATYVRLRRLARNNEVLRVWPRNCPSYFLDCKPCVEKHAFQQQISCSGHANCSVVFASQLFRQRDPDLEDIKGILCEASDHGSDGAKYFLMMLRALTRGRFSPNEVFSFFRRPL
jgi:hypothetical protein